MVHTLQEVHPMDMVLEVHMVMDTMHMDMVMDMVMDTVMDMVMAMDMVMDMDTMHMDMGTDTTNILLEIQSVCSQRLEVCKPQTLKD